MHKTMTHKAVHDKHTRYHALVIPKQKPAY